MVNQKLGFIAVAICFGYITTLTGLFVIYRGGLQITVRGSNFDSIYGYFGNPVAPLTKYPYIGIWVGHGIRDTPPELVDEVRC